jgi:prolyl-tRNA synthetase
MNTHGLSVLFDDRVDSKAGEKFAVADSIGIPVRVVVSAKTLSAGKIEAKARSSDSSELISLEDFYEQFGLTEK